MPTSYRCSRRLTNARLRFAFSTPNSMASSATDAASAVQEMSAAAGEVQTNAVETAVDQVVREEGVIDLLVNCAGITRDRALWNLADEDWESVIDVNLTGAWRVLKAVAHPMRERRRSSRSGGESITPKSSSARIAPT